MRLVFAASLAALALGVFACGGSNMSGVSGPTPATPPSNFMVDIAEINGPNSFFPSPAAVGFQQIVVWRNTDTVTHDVVFDDRSVDTGRLAPGTLSQPITVSPGTWTYHCSIHPTMVGSITVQGSTGASY
jgi:plastocyanin